MCLAIHVCFVWRYNFVRRGVLTGQSVVLGGNGDWTFVLTPSEISLSRLNRKCYPNLQSLSLLAEVGQHGRYAGGYVVALQPGKRAGVFAPNLTPSPTPPLQSLPRPKSESVQISTPSPPSHSAPPIALNQALQSGKSHLALLRPTPLLQSRSTKLSRVRTLTQTKFAQ